MMMLDSTIVRSSSTSTGKRPSGHLQGIWACRLLCLCSPTAVLYPGQAHRDNQMRQPLSAVDVINNFCSEIECDAEPMLNRLLNNHHPAHVIHTSPLRTRLV